MPEWAEISCFKEETPISREADKVLIEIPEKTKRFYDWERKHRVLSVNGNDILVTISGNLVEQKKYPS
jgi:hypothetical protein